MKFFAGIEIGGTKLQLVLGDDAGKILERRKFHVAPEAGAEAIRKHIREALPDLLQRGQAAAVGVGFGGPVDWRTGRICRSHHVEGWSEFAFADWLQPLAGCPVFVDNDGGVAALGEARCGAGAGHNPVFYVTLGSGVGGGLVVDGRIYHGAKPGEAEIGHVRLDRQGTTVESRCSGWAVDRRIQALKTTEPDGLLARRLGPVAGGEAKLLVAALGEGDATAHSILKQTADDLAFGLSHVVHLFHPEIIIIGGGLSNLGEPLRAAVESALRTFTMEAFLPGPHLVLAALGEDAVPVGALTLAKDRLEARV
jgi:glucokinase